MDVKLIKDIARKWALFERKTTKNFTPFQVRLWNALVFLLRFTVLAIPFHMVIWTNFDAYFLQAIVAKAVSYLLSLSGAFVSQAGNFLYIETPSLWTVEIIKDCVGWKSFLAFTGLIFAVRGASAKTRIAGVLLGAPVIFFGNIIRIYTSIYASLIFGVEKFSLIHDVLWQWGMILLVLLVWLFWMKHFQLLNSAFKGRVSTVEKLETEPNKPRPRRRGRIEVS